MFLIPACISELLYLLFICIFFIYLLLFTDINDSSLVVLPTDSSGGSYFPPVFRPKGLCTFMILFYFFQ